MKLLVSGKSDVDADTQVIDLFNDRVKETCDIDPRSLRMITREMKRAGIYEAWLRRRTELNQMFSGG